MNIRTDFDCVHEGLAEKAVNYFSQNLHRSQAVLAAFSILEMKFQDLK